MKHTILLIIALLSLTLLNAQVKKERPLLTIGCISDIHVSQAANTSLNNISLRESLLKTVKKMHSEENIDMMIIGGDCTGEQELDEAHLEKVRQMLVDAYRSAFPIGAPTPVICVSGNHEYEFGRCSDGYKQYNSGDYYSFPMKDDIGELSPEECFYETPSNGKGPTLSVLAAYHYVVKGFDFVVLNCGKYEFGASSDYNYSTASVQWIADKLKEIYAENPNKTVFFCLHIPFRDSNFIRVPHGIVDGAAADNLKAALSNYPNLIMLYGHDHGGDRAYTRRRTSQRVTLYDTNGDVLPTNDATHVEGPTEDPENDCREYIADHYVYNEASKQYINYGSGLTLTAKAGERIKFMNNINGYFNMFIHNESIHYSTSSKSFSYGTASPFLIMEVPSPAKVLKAHRVDSIKPGKQYMIITKSGSTYYAIKAVKTSTSDGSPRISATTVTVKGDSAVSTMISNYEELLWTINSDLDDGKNRLYICAHENGKFLSSDGGKLVLSKSPSYCKYIVKDSLDKSFNLTVENDLSEYIYSGAGGNFLLNPSNEDPLYFFKVKDPTAKVLTCVKTDNPTEPGSYVIVERNHNTPSKYYIMTSSTVTSGTMTAQSVIKFSDTLLVVAKNNNMWDVKSPETVLHQRTPSFISAFMGSMRYFTTAMNGDYVPTAMPEVVQALMIYVYNDRVELEMKNYNKTGLVSGIKLSKDIAPYILYRKVEGATGIGSVLKDDDAKYNKMRYDLWGKYSNGSNVVIEGRKKYLK